jgi:hypothetical protein
LVFNRPITKSTNHKILAAVLLLPPAAYIIWDQVESRALAREIAAIAARGEPVTTDEQPGGADTPERHDAARIYAAAAQRQRALGPEASFGAWSVDVDSVNPRPLSELEARLRPDTAPLQLADQAAPLDFNGFGDVELESEPALSTVGILADVRADLYSARGNGDEAAASLFSSARLQRALTDSFSQSRHMTRLLGSVRILLRHTSPSEAALARLQRAVAELPDSDALVRDVQRRRAQVIDDWSHPRAGVSEAILLRILRPSIARSTRAELSAIEDAMAVARAPWPAKVTAARELERKYEPAMRAMTARRGYLARLAVPYGPGIAAVNVGSAGTRLAARRIILAILAIERYRRAHASTPPDALDALRPTYLREVPLDPFSGAALVYRRAADRYQVYSVDADTTDNGGAFYGVGSKGQFSPPQGVPRDLGIVVEFDR